MLKCVKFKEPGAKSQESRTQKSRAKGAKVIYYLFFVFTLGSWLLILLTGLIATIAPLYCHVRHLTRLYNACNFAYDHLAIKGDHLIDEYRIIINPVILGDEKLQFTGDLDKKMLKFMDIKRFNSGVVILYYQPNK